ncbi:MAG: hypothetical protein JO020_17080 [Chloroflexi bacterium]|nr:hypothetical protein [Chloroflexota bacterium]MBV9895880.1 hypothetical protein [Chloroflexota bacterium]
MTFKRPTPRDAARQPDTSNAAHDQTQRSPYSARALGIRAELGSRLQELRLMQLELERHGGSREDSATVVDAAKHVEAAMAALSRVGGGGHDQNATPKE